MGRVHAVAYVALVEHMEPVGYRSIRQFPRTAMGAMPTILTGHIKDPISSHVQTPEPKPTPVVGLCDLRPKAFVNSSSESDLRHYLTLPVIPAERRQQSERADLMGIIELILIVALVYLLFTQNWPIFLVVLVILLVVFGAGGVGIRS